MKVWKRDCRTADAVRRRVNKALNDCLKYCEVTFFAAFEVRNLSLEERTNAL